MIDEKPSEGVAVMEVASRELRGVAANKARPAATQISSRKKTLSEVGRFVESQVQAYRMAFEAAAREARIATALAITRDEMIFDLRARIGERDRQLAAMKSERDIARAEAQTVAQQLRTVTESVMSPPETRNRRRWFGHN